MVFLQGSIALSNRFAHSAKPLFLSTAKCEVANLLGI